MFVAVEITSLKHAFSQTESANITLIRSKIKLLVSRFPYHIESLLDPQGYMEYIMEGPFQCLQKSRDVLIAASGSRIDSFSLQDGSVLSSWYCPYAPNNSTKRQQAKKFENSTAQNSESPSMNDLSNSAPVPKRRKLSGSEIVRPGVSENGGSNGANRKQKGSSAEPYDVSQAGLGAPTVVTLAISNDGSHVIAVTGDDKAIRVFRHDGVGHLVQLSKR